MIKHYKPTSPGRRGQTRLIGKSHTASSKKAFRKNMTKSLKGPVARSNGRITVQCRDRGTKRRLRVIDFKRDKYDVPGKVEFIDYDPTRSADVALILYADGERRYILSPEKLKVGDTVVSGEKVDTKAGNSMPLGKIPLGLPVHNIELYPQAGGKFIRSAGVAGYITAREGKYVNVRMPSGEVRKFLAKCYATIGQVGNEEKKLVKLGKAGRAYHKGRRPKTRGKARSDGHPLGGSYSRRLGRHPVDKWGNIAKGGKTRRRKHTNKYIVQNRRGEYV